MTRGIVGMVAVIVVGCGGKDEACLAYTTTYQACVDEAVAAGLPVDVDTSDPEGFCDSFADVEDAQWACEEAAYASGDCATQEGLDAILAEVEGC